MGYSGQVQDVLGLYVGVEGQWNPSAVQCDTLILRICPGHPRNIRGIGRMWDS